MRRMRHERWRVAALAVICAACGSSPTGPDRSTLTGTWTGTVADSAAGNGSATLSIVEGAAGLSGSWNMAFGAPAANLSGTLSGARTGSAVSLFLARDAPLLCGSGVTLSGTLAATTTVTDSRLQGSYSVLVCAGAEGGELDLERRR